MSLTKIGSIGINTGIAFAGVTTIATLNASDNVLSVGGTVNFVSDVSIGGTVSIAGTLTYEDVTNVDAVGLITARNGIVVNTRGVNVTGMSTITANGHLHPLLVTNSHTDGHGIRVQCGDSANDFSLLIEDKDANNLFEVMGDGEVHVEQQALMPKAGFNVTAGVSTFQGSVTMFDKLYHTGDADTAIRFPANDTITAETGGTERLRINSTGQTIVGDSVSQLSTSAERPFQVHSVNGPKIAIGRNDTSIVDGNTIGGLEFYGNDNNGTFVNTASIIVDADGTHGDDDKPTRMLFYTTADNASSATERMRIDNAGRVLIGTTTEGEASGDDLTIANSGDCGITIRSGTSSKAKLLFSDGTSGDDEYRGNIQYDHNGDYMKFSTNAGERLRIDSSSNMLLRGGSVSYLVLGTGGDSGFDATISNNMNWIRGNGDNLQMNCADNGYIAFETNGTERARIHDSLYMSFGTTETYPRNGGSVIEGGVGQLILSRSGTGGEVMIRFERDNATRGNITVSTSTTYNTTSDYRLKENVTDLSDAITRLKKITPRRFNFINDENKQLVDGFIAHEVSEAVPEAVSGTKDQVATADDVAANQATTVGEPIHQQVDYSKYVPLLTAALQEAVAKIETLETEVAVLKSQLNN